MFGWLRRRPVRGTCERCGETVADLAKHRKACARRPWHELGAPQVCRCICHRTTPGPPHAFPCCGTCPTCHERFSSGLATHRDECAKLNAYERGEPRPCTCTCHASPDRPPDAVRCCLPCPSCGDGFAAGLARHREICRVHAPGDPEACACPCHTQASLQHPDPCCSTCSACGGRFRRGFAAHRHACVDPEPCECACHRTPGMKHVMPCCTPCLACGGNFKRGYDKHRAICDSGLGGDRPRVR